MDKPDFADPAAVVTAFIRVMHHWEGLAGSLSRSTGGRFNPEGGSSMHPAEVAVSQFTRQIPPLIAAAFLTEAAAAKVSVGSYSIPPEYDPSAETIVRVVEKNTQCTVETDRKSEPYGGPREYLLKKVGAVWLIDGIRIMLGDKKRKLSAIL